MRLRGFGCSRFPCRVRRRLSDFFPPFPCRNQRKLGNRRRFRNWWKFRNRRKFCTYNASTNSHTQRNRNLQRPNTIRKLAELGSRGALLRGLQPFSV